MKRKNMRNWEDDSSDSEVGNIDSVQTIHVEVKAGSLIPHKGTPLSAAYDLRAAKNVNIPPYSTVKVPLNLKVHIPDGYFMLLLSRSGLATKGILTMNGVIDADYIDEIHSVVQNTTGTTFTVTKGARISQALLLPTYDVHWASTPTLEPARIVHHGFGSTGG